MHISQSVSLSTQFCSGSQTENIVKSTTYMVLQMFVTSNVQLHIHNRILVSSQHSPTKSQLIF